MDIEKQIALNHIGDIWKAYGRGPHEFDCYGLHWYINKEYNNRMLPKELEVDMGSTDRESRYIEDGLKQKWIETENPKTFDLVAMSKKRAIHHVGCFLDNDGGKVIHALDKLNVIVSTFSHLRKLGISTIKFYKYNG